MKYFQYFQKPSARRIAWAITGFAFFIFAYAFVCARSPAFRNYTLRYFEIWFWIADDDVLILFAAAAAFVAFGAVAWLNAGQLMELRVHRFPYLRCCLLAAGFIGFSAILLSLWHPAFMMILASTAVTAAALALWATTVVRVRAVTLRELIRLEDSYRLANEEKLRAERFKTELIANVSHDIRTPLTSIINYVDFIDRMNIENKELDQYVAVLKKTTGRLKTLISDLLDASKAGTGNVAMDIQALDLSELLGQTAGEFDGAFAEKGLVYVSRQAEVKSTVAADGKHLSRVLENLLGNAAKYALPGTRVYAEITEQDGGTGTGAGPGIGDGSGAGTVSLSIKNVSAAPLEVSPEMLTERFVRGERSRNTEGSGLGLYIAKYLLEGMGGSLTIGISGDLFDAAVKLPRARFCEKTPKA